MHKLLNQHLSDIKLEFPAAQTDHTGTISLVNSKFRITLAHGDEQISTDRFRTSTGSPISAPFRVALEAAIELHNCHVTIKVENLSVNDSSVSADVLGLRILHAITTYMALSQHPLAVYWAQSDQLITGPKYLELSEDYIPWALLAKASVFSSGFNAFGQSKHGLRLDEAARFIGRPILFHETDQPLHTTLAASLAFMRHAIETGSVIPDGNTFGLEGISPVKVAHKAPYRGNQFGMFELSAVNNAPLQSGSFNSPFRVELPSDANLAEEFAIDRQRERTRSLAISYMMLVIMPPVGLLLLFVNLAFGANSNRTGLVASCTIAVLMVVGAFVFLNTSEEHVASLGTASTISTATLEN